MSKLVREYFDYQQSFQKIWSKYNCIDAGG